MKKKLLNWWERARTVDKVFEDKSSGDMYVDRLVKEWKQHGKIIISIDFDSTISPYHTIDNQPDIDAAINLIKRVQGSAYNVIFTACHPDRFDEITYYCDKQGIRVDSINKNPISLPYGTSGKIYYNVNLCDRSGLKEAMNILETAYYIYRGWKQSEKPLTEIG